MEFQNSFCLMASFLSQRSFLRMGLGVPAMEMFYVPATYSQNKLLAFLGY
jgi:hypothetical protein